MDNRLPKAMVIRYNGKKVKTSQLKLLRRKTKRKEDRKRLNKLNKNPSSICF